MNSLEAIIAGAIQGTIEWLPISSEAQTMLYFLNVLHMDPQIALSYAFYLHFGTMLAVILRFRKEFIQIITNLRLEYKPTKILVIASLSTAITGVPLYLLLKNISIGQNSSTFTILIGLLLIITGLIMRASGVPGRKNIEDITDMDMVITGIAQGCAILPGISRSGITVAALLARKISQEKALIISFLLSVPAALAIFIIDFGTIRLIPVQNAIILTISSFSFGYVSMNALLKIARKTSFWIFCIILGSITIVFTIALYAVS